jgi:hypothetical protein
MLLNLFKNPTGAIRAFFICIKGANLISNTDSIIPGTAASGTKLIPILFIIKTIKSDPTEKPSIPPRDIMEFDRPFLLPPKWLADAAVGG